MEDEDEDEDEGSDEDMENEDDRRQESHIASVVAKIKKEKVDERIRNIKQEPRDRDHRNANRDWDRNNRRQEQDRDHSRRERERERRPTKEEEERMREKEMQERERLRKERHKQLEERSNQAAHGLCEMGISDGCRVVLMVKPSIDLFTLVFAIFKAGAVPVLVDPGIGLKYLKQCIGEAEPTAFIGIPPAHVARLILGWGKKTIGTKLWVGGGFSFGLPTLKDLLKKHASNIYGKLNVANRTQAAARARELGLLPADS